MAETRRVLLVANRTAMTPALRDEVRKRAAEGDTSFHLLVPAHPSGLHRVVDPEVAGREAARKRLEEALEALGEAAGSSPVTGEVGDADPLAAIQDAINARGFDEVVISTLPKRISKWLHLDLPSKARGLGLPVPHIESMPAGEPVAA
ncbi:MAG TPA: hypothetical protein VGV10_00890 [Thermoleophilaceae bacterium]|nr:hypothetical protein [Thermoleophilaceae bacterium]